MRFVLPLLVFSFGVLAPGSASATVNKVTLVASGLDSPRGIAFVGDRAVVAESGHGGPQCFSVGPLGTACGGATSQISWVDTKTGTHTPLATGFMSVAAGDETLGLSGLSVRGNKLYAQMSLTSREVPPAFTIGQQAGQLFVVNPSTGKWKSVASVGDFNFDWTLAFVEPTSGVFSPGTQEHDANPTGILATGDGILVADSGANVLNLVDKNGKVSIVHYFPWRDPNPNNFPSDEVPTCVARTDDALWVGTLAGHLFRVEEGKATEVVPKDSTGKRLLSHVTGCTAGHGALYLVNMFGAGQFSDPTIFDGNVVKYSPEGGKASMLADAFTYPALFLPYSPAIGPDGNLYVTAGAICPVSGQGPPGPINPCTIGDAKGGRVVKISLPHQDED
jgi:hypothetical protein